MTTKRRASETYDLVSHARKQDLRRLVHEALTDIRYRLLDLGKDDAERAVIAQAYLQEHAAGGPGVYTAMGDWANARLDALQALQRSGRARTQTALALHLGLTLPRIRQILAPTRGVSRRTANTTAAARRAPSGGQPGRPTTKTQTARKDQP